MIPGKKYAPEDFLEIAWRRKWIIIVPLVLAGVGTFLYSRALPNVYRSEAKVLIIPQQVPEKYIGSAINESINRRLNLIREQILSRARLERIIEEFDLYRQERRVLLMDQVIEQMRRDVNINVARAGRREDPNHFTVSYDSRSPQTAMQVAERLASLFVRENLEGRNLQSDATTQFLQSQVDESLRQLQQHEASVEAFKREHSGRLPDQVESNLQLMRNARQQIQALSDGIHRDRERKIAVERRIAEETTLGPLVASGRPAPAAADSSAPAAQQLASARATLDAMLLRLKDDHPDVRTMRSRIRDLEMRAEAEALQQPVGGAAQLVLLSPAEAERARRLSQLRAELEKLDRDVKLKEAGIERAQATLQQQERSVMAAPALQSQMLELMRNYGILRGTYENLLRKLQDAKLAASLEQRQVSQQFRIIDQARRPDQPRSPDRLRMNLVGSVLGLGIGLLFAGLLEYRDSSLRTADDVVVALSLPVLALVPTMHTAADHRFTRLRMVVFRSTAATLALVSLVVVAWKLGIFENWGR